MRGNVNKSLRRHAKRNHASVGGIGHMGRRSSTPKVSTRAPDDRPEPMKVALSDFLGATPNTRPG
jgi:hypothetical protein